DDTTKVTLPDSLRFPVRLARLAAFATYSRDDWSALPSSRAKLLIDDAEALVKELDSVCKRTGLPAHDLRLANYMYVEALRMIGHVELLRVIVEDGANFYENKRPTGLKNAALGKEAGERIRQAIRWMLACEQLSPSCALFCDLAEA